MRKRTALIACVTLPFMTAVVANVITPGYALVGHTTTLLISLVVGMAALYVIALNMKDRPSSPSGWLTAAGWVLSGSILIVTLFETVILKPGGIDNRQWFPTLALMAIAIVALCEKNGDSPDRQMILRASSLGGIIMGGVLICALAASAAAGRLSGDDLWTLAITASFAPLILGAMIQTQRVDDRARAWMGATTLAFVFTVVVMSSGIYAWSPHYSSDAIGREMFE